MLHIETIHIPTNPETRYNWEYLAGSYDLSGSERNSSDGDVSDPVKDSSFESSDIFTASDKSNKIFTKIQGDFVSHYSTTQPGSLAGDPDGSSSDNYNKKFTNTQYSVSRYPVTQPGMDYSQDFIRGETALSTNQRVMAQTHFPTLLAEADRETDYYKRAGRDREIQEKLRDNKGYKDRSRRGHKAWKENCKVIHNTSIYGDKTVKPRLGNTPKLQS